VASIPFVRHQIARLHGRSQPGRRVSDGFPVAAVPLAPAAWLAGRPAPAALGAVAVLATVQLALARRRPPTRATIAGVQQSVLGLVLVLVLTTAIVIALASGGLP
jgi:hypothetical protein